MDYNQKTNSAAIRSLFARPGQTAEVQYQELLRFHCAKVHYELRRDNPKDLGSLEPCGGGCSQASTCQRMQQALLVADYIRIKMGDQEPLFRLLHPPMAVGSLKENSRLFQYGDNIPIIQYLNTYVSDELDATLLLGGDIKKYLSFNIKNQNVEISFNLPSDHPLQKYNDQNVLNVKKFYKKVSFNT